MRIAVLTTASIFAGAERHSLQLAMYLRSQGHDAFLACVGDTTYRVYKDAIGEAVPLMLIKAILERNTGGFFQWRKIFRELQADICVFEKPTLLHGSVRLDLAARICHKRYITIQQVAPYELPNLWVPFFGKIIRFRLWVLKARLKGYARSIYPHLTIAVSNSVRQKLISLYGFNSRKTRTVRNGVSSEQYKPDSVLRASGRKEYDIPENALVFGTACRLSPEKGLDFGLSCFLQIIREFPGSSIAWLIAGNGPLESEIRKEIEILGLQRHVRLLGFCKNVEQFYASCDFYLLPSRREGLPLSLLEAMSTGCCPIATAVDGTPEVLSSSKVGWLVPPDNPEKMISAMREAVSLTSQEREHLSRRSREHVQKYFELKGLLQEIASVLQ
jgi:glycosyltransferase involved in cell wall biosynthesis